VRSLHKAFTVLGIAGTTRGSAIKNTTDAAERALRDGSGSVEEHHGGKRVLSWSLKNEQDKHFLLVNVLRTSSGAVRNFRDVLVFVLYRPPLLRKHKVNQRSC